MGELGNRKARGAAVRRAGVNAMIAASPMKRLGTVDEVAEMVLWLCSDACSYSTGAVFDISGGRGTY